MGTICKVGETKEINGKLYRKVTDAKNGPCSGCAFLKGKCPGHSVEDAIEDGGTECCGAIWEQVSASTTIDRTKAPKVKSTKHVWEPRTLEIKDSVPKTTLRALILEGLDEINQLGTENAKLKNQIASRKQKGAK